MCSFGKQKDIGLMNVDTSFFVVKLKRNRKVLYYYFHALDYDIRMYCIPLHGTHQCMIYLTACILADVRILPCFERCHICQRIILLSSVDQLYFRLNKKTTTKNNDKQKQNVEVGDGPSLRHRLACSGQWQMKALL